MPYLLVEFKAIDQAAIVAKATGKTSTEILGGLVETRHHCWSRKVKHVSTFRLRATFGNQGFEQVLEALQHTGFIERMDGSQGEEEWRIRGADRYLRISENRAKAGQASAQKRAEKRATGVEQVLNTCSTGVEQNTNKTPFCSTGVQQISTPYTDHRTLITEHKKEKHSSVSDETSDTSNSQYLRETEGSEAEKQKSLKTSINELQAIYNAKLGDTHSRWQKTPQKRNAAATRWLKTRTVDDWSKLLDLVKEQPFLMGQSQGGWLPNADWLLIESNAVKVEEGTWKQRIVKALPSMPKPERPKVLTKEERAELLKDRPPIRIEVISSKQREENLDGPPEEHENEGWGQP